MQEPATVQPDSNVYGNHTTVKRPNMVIFGCDTVVEAGAYGCYVYGSNTVCDAANCVIVGRDTVLGGSSCNCTVYGTVARDSGLNNTVLPLPALGEQLPKFPGKEWASITTRAAGEDEDPEAIHFAIDMSNNPNKAIVEQDALHLSKQELVERYGDFFAKDQNFTEGIYLHNKLACVLLHDVYHEGRVVASAANGRTCDLYENCAYDTEGRLVYDGNTKQLGPGAVGYVSVDM
jgi:hypothetical protein